MLKPILFFSAVILFAYAATPISGGVPQDPTPAPAQTQAAASTAKNPVKPTADSQAKAKSLYQMDCAMCHGDNGNGKTDLATSMALSLKDWTDAKSLAGKSDQDLFNTIRKGTDKMPPEAEGRAKDDMVWNLIIYLRSFAK
jgi:mono/diheme cytochrome c family protein